MLANRLQGRITLLVPQVVPYPLGLQNSADATAWNERRFRVIAGESRVETTVQIQLCRDRFEAVAAFLTPHSLVVLGGKRRRFWPTLEQRFERQLRRAGHEVIFAEMA